MPASAENSVSNNRRPPEEIQNSKDLYEAFRMMKLGDPPLIWDSTAMHQDAKNLYEIARGLGRMISIRCDPPLRRGYHSCYEGQMTITRFT